MKTLITKFKGEISDKSIPRYDIMSLEFPSTFNVSENVTVNINVSDGKQVAICSDGNSEVSLMNSSGVVFGTTPYTLSHRTDARDFKAAAGSQLYIKGIKNLSYFVIGNRSGSAIPQLKADSKDLNYLFDKSDITCIIVRRQDGVTCDIETLVGEKTGFTTIFLSDNTASNISGNISYLAGSIGLTLFVASSSSVSGNIEDLADSMVANGRVSGTLQVNVTNTPCTGIPNIGKNVDITFTDDTTTYPRGWYATAHQ